MNRSVSTGSVAAGKPATKAERAYGMFSTSEDEDNNAAAFRNATTPAPTLTRRFSQAIFKDPSVGVPRVQRTRVCRQEVSLQVLRVQEYYIGPRISPELYHIIPPQRKR